MPAVKRKSSNRTTKKKVVKTRGFFPMIRSRHPSHSCLRRSLKKLPFRSVIRFGSTTQMNDKRIEINTVEAVQTSMNKLRMKHAFSSKKVNTARWFTFSKNRFFENGNGESMTIEEMPYPIVAKSHYGSRGKGNTKIDSSEEMEEFIKSRSKINNYIFEVFYNYAREYRLHITEDGCFYACRKVLKKDTPQEARWYRNDDHCNWIREDGENKELFDKPVNWNEIVDHSIEALKATGLDIGAVDVKVQSATDGKGKLRKECEFIVIEINSAPSFGDITEVKYREELPKLLIKKWNSQ